MNILDTAKNLLKTIEESDKKYGVGDRSTEENEAIESLKASIVEFENYTKEILDSIGRQTV